LSNPALRSLLLNLANIFGVMTTHRGGGAITTTAACRTLLESCLHGQHLRLVGDCMRDKEVSCTEFKRQLKTLMFQTNCGAS